MLQEAEKKNGVGMALDVATLPLILYRKVYTHALSMYYIARTSYTFLYLVSLLEPFLLHFSISMFQVKIDFLLILDSYSNCSDFMHNNYCTWDSSVAG